jgi:hypothetical protein
MSSPIDGGDATGGAANGGGCGGRYGSMEQPCTSAAAAAQAKASCADQRAMSSTIGKMRQAQAKFQALNRR